MSRKHPWFALYPDDFLDDTPYLTTEQVGAYCLLLMTSWKTGPLSPDPVHLARICRISKTRFVRHVWPELLRFFTQHEGLLHQKRMEQERDKVATISSKRVLAKTGGKAGKKSKKTEEKVEVFSAQVTDNIQSGGHTCAVQPQPQPQSKKESPPAADSLGRDRPAIVADLVSGNTVVPFVGSASREAFDAWNAAAARLGLTQAKSFSEPRQRRLAARLRECSGIAGWMAALVEVEASDWLCGRLPDKSWKVDLDWLLSPGRFGQVRDGACRDWGKGSAARSSGHEWMAAGPPPAEFEFDGLTIDGKADSA